MKATELEWILEFLTYFVEDVFSIVNLLYFFAGLIVCIFICVLIDFFVLKFREFQQKKGETDE